MNRLVAYLPTYRPVGGVLKVLDYAVHAIDLGLEVTIASQEEYRDGLIAFDDRRRRALTPDNGVRHVHGFGVGITPSDIAFFSWPRHYEEIALRLGPLVQHRHVVHIVQNVRHANPAWDHGYPRRLLTRPMSRIYTNDVVRSAVAGLVHDGCPHAVIRLGHDVDFFASERDGLGSPIRVVHPTWKSRVGERVADLLERDERFTFEAIEGEVAPGDLRDAYQRADVVLGAPIAEEGFYMPGLEAMAAGALLIVPDAGGNMAYCRFGDNCLRARLEDAGSYVEALEAAAAMTSSQREEMRASGLATAALHTLHQESEGFGRFLTAISD